MRSKRFCLARFAPRYRARSSVPDALVRPPVPAPMADAVTAGDVAIGDPLLARQRHVRAAVAELLRAFGAEAGATYRRHVEAWEASLDPAAKKLAAFPTGLKKAGTRLPTHSPAIREAREGRRGADALERVCPGGCEHRPRVLQLRREIRRGA